MTENNDSSGVPRIFHEDSSEESVSSQDIGDFSPWEVQEIERLMFPPRPMGRRFPRYTNSQLWGLERNAIKKYKRSLRKRIKLEEKDDETLIGTSLLQVEVIPQVKVESTRAVLVNQAIVISSDEEDIRTRST